MHLNTWVNGALKKQDFPLFFVMYHPSDNQLSSSKKETKKEEKIQRNRTQFWMQPKIINEGNLWEVGLQENSLPLYDSKKLDF